MSSQSREALATPASSSSRERELPKKSDLVEYNYAVAGHAGTMTDADGELFIKPCTQAEVDFYDSAQNHHPEFAHLMPTYLGTLSLNEQTDEAAIHAQIPDLVEHAHIPDALKHEIQSHLHLEDREAVSKQAQVEQALSSKDNWVPNKARKIKTDRAVVLENASWGFKRPNIMDTKLGTRLWADDAPQQKKDRFEKISAETTHKTFGFRVAGMRAWRGSADPAELDDEGYRIYDKDWGRVTVNDDNLVSSIKKFVFNEAAGVDQELGKTIAGVFATDLRRVQEVLEQEESRMYSASLLFVFEGDGQALREAIAEEKARAERSEAATAAAVAAITAAQPALVHERGIDRAAVANLRVDSGIGMDEEELLKELELPGEVVNIEELAEDEGDESDDELSSFPHIYTLKLIDFAHATWTPGQGPDENVLLGVRSLAKIFEDISD